jgi:hypothetical protein
MLNTLLARPKIIDSINGEFNVVSIENPLTSRISFIIISTSCSAFSVIETQPIGKAKFGTILALPALIL